MFNQHAERIVEAARAFRNWWPTTVMCTCAKYNQDVDNAERAADRVTSRWSSHAPDLHHAHRPRQIHSLISTMDDVADLIQDSAPRPWRCPTAT